MEKETVRSGLRLRPGFSMPSSSKLLPNLKKLDVYNKVHDDYSVKTSSGGLLSIVSFAIMFLLFVSETRSFMRTEITDRIVVDTHLDQPLPIDLQVAFPNLRCEDVSVDTVDSVGEHQSNIVGTLTKTPFNSPSVPSVGSSSISGKDVCNSCFDAAGSHSCCNTCDDLNKAYVASNLPFQSVLRRAPQCAQELGCRISGKVMVNKVNGNVHVALGKSSVRDGKLIHEFNPEDVKAGFDTSHVIERLSFGDAVPGVDSTLEGRSKSAEGQSMMYHYYVKLVPTTFKTAKAQRMSEQDAKERGLIAFTNQYSATETARKAALSPQGQLNGLPGVFIVYDFTPFLVEKIEKAKTWGHYFTNLVAIIGGVFAVSTFLDGMVYSSVKRLRNKGIIPPSARD